MIYEFGAIVVVPFPFVDHSVVKKRPALVLSSKAFNTANGQTLLAMITTAARSTWPSDIVISDGGSAGLLHRSMIRWKVFTLPNATIERRLGFLSESDLAAVRTSVQQHLAV